MWKQLQTATISRASSATIHSSVRKATTINANIILQFKLLYDNTYEINNFIISLDFITVAVITSSHIIKTYIN